MSTEINGAPHLGREQSIEALGKTWRLCRWDRAIWFDFLEWAKGQLVSPLDSAEKMIDHLLTRQADCMAKAAADPAGAAVWNHKGNLYGQQASNVLQDALEKRRAHLSVTSPEVIQLLESIQGGGKILHLLLQRHQPDATEEQAFDIVMELGKKAAEIFTIAAGKPPGPAKGNASSPAPAARATRHRG